MTHQEIRIKAANSDLRAARKYNVMTICQTVIGNIQVAFNDGIFTMTNFNDGSHLMTGKAKDAVAFLAPQYVIE